MTSAKITCRHVKVAEHPEQWVWMAEFKGYAYPVGMGRTEADAIADLKFDHVCYRRLCPGA